MSSPPIRNPVRRAARATFSDELRDQIERSGQTPYALGKRANIDPGILSRFLSGERGMTTHVIDRLAAALSLHVGTAGRAKGRPRRDSPPATELELDPDPDPLDHDLAGESVDPGPMGDLGMPPIGSGFPTDPGRDSPPVRGD